VLGLSEMVGDVLADARRDKNGRHALAGLFRQSVLVAFARPSASLLSTTSAGRAMDQGGQRRDQRLIPRWCILATFSARMHRRTKHAL
jgi:hypothetical protein